MRGKGYFPIIRAPKLQKCVTECHRMEGLCYLMTCLTVMRTQVHRNGGGSLCDLNKLYHTGFIDN